MLHYVNHDRMYSALMENLWFPKNWMFLGCYRSGAASDALVCRQIVRYHGSVPFTERLDFLRAGPWFSWLNKEPRNVLRHEQAVERHATRLSSAASESTKPTAYVPPTWCEKIRFTDSSHSIKGEDAQASNTSVAALEPATDNGAFFLA